jgi:hypothetical protein
VSVLQSGLFVYALLVVTWERLKGWFRAPYDRYHWPTVWRIYQAVMRQRWRESRVLWSVYIGVSLGAAIYGGNGWAGRWAAGIGFGLFFALMGLAWLLVSMSVSRIPWCATCATRHRVAVPKPRKES